MGLHHRPSTTWNKKTGLRKTYSATFGSAPKARDARDESPGPGAYGQNFSVRVLGVVFWGKEVFEPKKGGWKMSFLSTKMGFSGFILVFLGVYIHTCLVIGVVGDVDV